MPRCDGMALRGFKDEDGAGLTETQGDNGQNEGQNPQGPQRGKGAFALAVRKETRHGSSRGVLHATRLEEQVRNPYER